MSERVLLVEDEDLVGTLVRMNLAHAGYEVHWERTGDGGLAAAREGAADVLILDIALPGVGGLDILAAVRSAGMTTPVLMLTARGDVASKVTALSLGADDYLAKPFDVEELLARVQALLRRARADRQVPSSQLLRFGAFRVDLSSRVAETNEGRTVLSEKETAFLRLLAAAAGRTLARNEILDAVWGVDAMPTERTVDNLVLRLRKLFEPDPDRPRHILTVRGEGYRFER